MQQKLCFVYETTSNNIPAANSELKENHLVVFEKIDFKGWKWHMLILAFRTSCSLKKTGKMFIWLALALKKFMNEILMENIESAELEKTEFENGD